MSINDSIGNGTIGSTAPAEGAAERVFLKESELIKNSLRKALSICDAGKQKRFGRIEQRKTAPSWRRACGRGSLLCHHSDCRSYVQKANCSKATDTATEADGNEASQGERHARDGYRAHCGAGQFSRPAWPWRHPADARIDRSNAPKSNSDATDKPAAAKPRAGRTLASVPTFEQTQQKWEDPAPYGEATNQPAVQNQQQNALKEPSLVFVRSVTQSSPGHFQIRVPVAMRRRVLISRLEHGSRRSSKRRSQARC